MKKTIYFSIVSFLIILGCSKSDDFPGTQDETLLKSSRIATPINGVNGLSGVMDNSSILQTGLWAPPEAGPAPKYSFAQFPNYDFTPYYLNGESEYNPANYDLMAHFVYVSSEPITGAVVEFTFPHIEYFVPHVTAGGDKYKYTVNNVNNQTVIPCTTDLVMGKNPMFCFLVKVDCGRGENGLTTFWTDMKVNGVSVKGTIKNKVFACN